MDRQNLRQCRRTRRRSSDAIRASAGRNRPHPSRGVDDVRGRAGHDLSGAKSCGRPRSGASCASRLSRSSRQRSISMAGFQERDLAASSPIRFRSGASTGRIRFSDPMASCFERRQERKYPADRPRLSCPAQHAELCWRAWRMESSHPVQYSERSADDGQRVIGWLYPACLRTKRLYLGRSLAARFSLLRKHPISATLMPDAIEQLCRYAKHGHAETRSHDFFQGRSRQQPLCGHERHGEDELILGRWPQRDSESDRRRRDLRRNRPVRWTTPAAPMPSPIPIARSLPSTAATFALRAQPADAGDEVYRVALHAPALDQRPGRTGDSAGLARPAR